MNFLFDSSQFIVITQQLPPDKIANLSTLLASLWGRKLLVDKEVNESKLGFLNSLHLQIRHVFELCELEFQGEFEEWADKKLIPDRIRDFLKCNELLGQHVARYTFVLVNVPSLLSGQTLKEGFANSDDLIELLFKRSLFYAGDDSGPEVMVLSHTD